MSNTKAKNTICLWFNKDAQDAARFYAATFPNSEVTAVHKAPGDYANRVLKVPNESAQHFDKSCSDFLDFPRAPTMPSAATPNLGVSQGNVHHSQHIFCIWELTPCTVIARIKIIQEFKKRFQRWEAKVWLMPLHHFSQQFRCEWQPKGFRASSAEHDHLSEAMPFG